MNIVVVALGKIGLPLAVQFATKDHRVVGCDVNEDTVRLVNEGIAPFPGETDLESKLATVVDAGSLQATTDTTGAVAGADAVVIVVPLFVDEDGVPDFEWMDAATRDVGRGLTAGTLVSYETTLPVGTTRDRFADILAGESGLTAGSGFDLVFSPERVFTGRVFADLRRYPKLVGGINEDSAMRGVAFYEAVLDFDERPDLSRENGVWNLGSCEASEMAKLAETTYRDVNIGLANQFARYSADNGIDVYQVIEACNSQPFSHIHQPGVAVGGHCIPIYPQMYLWNDPDASVVRSARAANADMPVYAAQRLAQSHGDLDGQTVVVLGAAYRGGVKETAFSGVFPLVEELSRLGASVQVHDPMYSDAELVELGFSPYTLGNEAHAVIVQANHADYQKLSSQDVPGVRTVLDGRRILTPAAWDVDEFVLLGRAPQ
jgi:nucleotide sugar dehydrogenase